MNKLKLIEVVNRRYVHPRNVIAAMTDKLSHQPTFETVGAELGLTINDSTSFDPAGGSGETGTAIPAEIFLLADASDELSVTVEEVLSGSGNMYTTTFPVDFFRAVWIDGLLSLPQIHWTLSGSSAILMNTSLLSDTEVLAQYVIGNDE